LFKSTHGALWRRALVAAASFSSYFFFSCAGQCEEASYDFCCLVGTPCDCTQPPVDNA
jgi:hypothetical protein